MEQPPIQLDPDQCVALRTLFAGTNVAAVGPAGCGKSALVRAVVSHGLRTHGALGVLVLAWTGSAAQLVHGRTLASVLRTTVGDPSKERILRRVVSDPNLLAEVRHTKLVVIDEAPTIQGRWMDRLEFVLRRTAPTLVAECLPFGGRTVLAVGDPLQLPAFGVTGTSAEVSAYETRSWYDTFSSYHGTTIPLSRQYRQDPCDPLLSILMRLRVGDVLDDDIVMLNSTWPAASVDDFLDHVHLRAANVDVDTHNDKMLLRLPGEPADFHAHDVVNVDHPDRQHYAQQKLRSLARDVLLLKVGAVVVLTRAVGDLCTGARGTIVSIESGVGVHCLFSGGRDAVAVHPVAFDLKDSTEETLATRTQLPLLLGWAMTITRSQGMSLERVAVDFSNRWTLDGLVYTALSRCKGFAGLRVRGLTRAHVRVSARALQFYHELLPPGGG